MQVIAGVNRSCSQVLNAFKERLLGAHLTLLWSLYFILQQRLYYHTEFSKATCVLHSVYSHSYPTPCSTIKVCIAKCRGKPRGDWLWWKRSGCVSACIIIVLGVVEACGSHDADEVDY